MVQPDKFPFLSEEEFGFACRSFVETFEERGKDYVVVTKNLNFNPISRESILMPALSSSDEEADIEFSDQDTEDAVRL
ncbi:MAG: hypothetical protein M1812_000402 [Candelaria pacifica]|nr:MAG: hypothetical protein M1812_000402 [Candelaria pacifica]